MNPNRAVRAFQCLRQTPPAFLPTRRTVVYPIHHYLKPHPHQQQQQQQQQRQFHFTARTCAVKPFLLADIGEGIRECEVIQWFVEAETRVEQFDKLCEVQSDKASVEITSRYDGVIKKLHYDAGEMAVVGKPLVDIDVQSEIGAVSDGDIAPAQSLNEPLLDVVQPEEEPQRISPGHGLSLATPAVRHLAKEQGVDITQVSGTDKGGRVSKEDVFRYVENRDPGPSPTSSSTTPRQPEEQEKHISLTPIQHHMFKTMSRSLSIPHFLYSDDYNLDNLTSLRAQINQHPPPTNTHPLTALPFLIKAISLSLHEHTLLNSCLDTSTPPTPSLLLRPQHNISIAISTPHGLLVPTIKHVQSLSIPQIAHEIHRLTSLASQNRLSPQDLQGGTFTVSNIGSIGGNVVAPVIVDSQVCVVGIGRAKAVPVFTEHDGRLVKQTRACFSYAADHRVVDGAVVARFSNAVKRLVETPQLMLARLA
ncbi:MAG: hypothetical protein M1816_000813 [Peltula sp. TS41687]|nr:MAG: hypothetical protein M1816_000813 [Peltula sp. TS41687]